jgi:hypothetical protein
MVADLETEVTSTLTQATGELQALARTTEGEVELIARAFEDLAGQADAISNLAAAIVGCVDNESVTSVLPKVQTLGTEAGRFVSQRLDATTDLLAMVTTEVELLRRLTLITRGQEAIVAEIRVVSVLTKIEVARLHNAGANFLYLARELTDFSKSVAADTLELTTHTDGRRAAIEDTKHVLAAELPRLRTESSRIEADLANALATAASGLTQLSRTPAQFRTSVADIARQIAGVVAAIQAHDITRQQIEHVQAAFALISTRMRDAGNSENGIPHELSQIYAGLTIQIYQLRNVKQTVASWTSQIRTCMRGIHRVSTSDVVGLGPLVLDQEREISSQLARIDALVGESEAYSERIQRTFGGLSNLSQLVAEHLQRAKSTRGSLRLLTFNSIIEGSRLGTQASAILSISKSIKGTSDAWGEIADQSGHVMQEILDLVKQTNDVMETFLPASLEKLRDAQVQTGAGLSLLRTAAAFAAGRSREMKAVTEKMKARVAEMGDTGSILDACADRVDTVLTEIESLRRRLELDHPGVTEPRDAAAVEQMFSAFYTTEMERDVLRAALYGTAPPEVQQTFAGNSVELF